MKTIETIWPLYSILILLLIGCGDENKQSENVVPHLSAKRVNAYTVQSVSENEVIKVYGEIKQPEEYHLSFQTSGKVIKVNAQKGRRVKKGTVLAELEDIFSRDKIEKIELSKVQLQRNIDELQSEELRITKQLKDNEELYQDSLLSKDVLDNTAQTLLNIQTSISNAQSEMKIAEKNKGLSLSEQKLNKLSSPVNGLITQVNIKIGETMVPGHVAIVLKSSEEDRVFEIKVSDKEMVMIEVGDDAEIQLDALPDKSIPAQVTYLPFAKETGSYPVELSFGHGLQEVISGLFGSAIVKTSKIVSGLQIPLSAVIWADGNKGKVLINSNGKAKSKEVEILKIKGDLLIVKGALDEGDQVMLNVNGVISDGDDIVITDYQ